MLSNLVSMEGEKGNESVGCLGFHPLLSRGADLFCFLFLLFFFNKSVLILKVSKDGDLFFLSFSLSKAHYLVV